MPKVKSNSTDPGFLTYDQIRVNDILVSYRSDGEQSRTMGVVCRVNRKSVCLKLLKVDETTLTRVGVSESSFDWVRAIHSYKYTIEEILNGKAPLTDETRLIDVTPKGVLKTAGRERYKYFNNETRFHKIFTQEMWSKDESLKDDMKKAGGHLAKLLEVAYRATQQAPEQSYTPLNI